jgi:hypothetical protein
MNSFCGSQRCCHRIASRLYCRKGFVEVQDGDEALRPGQIEDAPRLSQSRRYLLAMKRHQIIPA